MAFIKKIKKILTQIWRKNSPYTIGSNVNYYSNYAKQWGISFRNWK
jgi:hypothetical protein